MVRKVEFFEAPTIEYLQKIVNKFLEDLRDYNVVDIKYNQSMVCTKMDDDGYGPGIQSWYSAMVLYTDHPVPKAET